MKNYNFLYLERSVLIITPTYAFLTLVWRSNSGTCVWQGSSMCSIPVPAESWHVDSIENKPVGPREMARQLRMYCSCRRSELGSQHLNLAVQWSPVTPFEEVQCSLLVSAGMWILVVHYTDKKATYTLLKINLKTRTLLSNKITYCVSVGNRVLHGNSWLQGLPWLVTAVHPGLGDWESFWVPLHLTESTAHWIQSQARYLLGCGLLRIWER